MHIVFIGHFPYEPYAEFIRGYHPSTQDFISHEGGLQYLRHETPDVIILSSNMPENFIHIIRRELKQTAPIMVIASTGRDSLTKRVGFLDSGADDYVVMPDPYEVTARIRVLMRRSHGNHAESRIRVGDLTLDLTMPYLFIGDGPPLKLAGNVYKLMTEFMLKPGRLLTKLNILRVFEGTDGKKSGPMVTVYVHKIRELLAENGSKSTVENIHGRGYTFYPAIG